MFSSPRKIQFHSDSWIVCEFLSGIADINRKHIQRHKDHQCQPYSYLTYELKTIELQGYLTETKIINESRKKLNFVEECVSDPLNGVSSAL